MRKISLAVLFYVLGIGFYHKSWRAPEKGESAFVESCHDGDTCTLLFRHFAVLHRKSRARLYGIDAPELAQPRGPAAGKKLSDEIVGKTVSVVFKDLDRYGRIVVELHSQQENINLKMVEEGWAEAYHRFPIPQDLRAYLAAEKDAKKKHLGIWAEKNYLSPKKFRQKMKIGCDKFMTNNACQKFILRK